MVGLSLFGTGALLYTLDLSRKATGAALAANATAREHMTTDLRAWIMAVGLQSGTATNVSSPDGVHPEAVLMALEASNKGRTPALNVRISGELKVVERDAPVPEFTPQIPDTPGGVLGPEMRLGHAVQMLVGQERLDFLARTKVAYLYLVITYRTVFDDTVRTTQICCRVSANGEDITETGIAKIRFEYGPYGPQNTAD